ncbi:MAG: SulP family inorganic anion transporter, partial [Anaerolineae bacterium]|nr:SulP family inorganic anion transporter [Anaerolineae bacterium]
MTVIPAPPEAQTAKSHITLDVNPLFTYIRQVLTFFARPIILLRTYRVANLRYDLIAGLTVAIISLPQSIAFALISELPAQVGLYTAIVGSIVGALWGSSNHLQTGPTNTTSLLVLSTLLAVAQPNTPEYLAAAGMMALLVGLFRLLLGLARLGVLVNFVSDSVIVGFTSGAGILLIFNQIRNLLRLEIPSTPTLWQTIPLIVTHLLQTHWPSLLIGAATIAIIVVLRRINPRWPGPLIAMVAASAVVALLGLDAQGVRIVGAMPHGLPQLARLPLGDWKLASQLATGSLAIAVIGLVETISIARMVAARTGQRLDSNQEFVGQGLANIASAFFSGYTCAGSFTRTPVNYEAGARTPLASAFSGLLVLVVMLVLAPLAAYVPLAALAGTLMLTAYGLIDKTKIARVWRSAPGDRLIMIVTCAGALALPLQYAVLSGIALSVGYYLIRTSKPRVHTVLPDDQFRHLSHQPGKPPCPQFSIVEVLGDM